MLIKEYEGLAVKTLMTKLLADDVFDGFLFHEALVVSSARFQFELADMHQMWQELRPIIFSCIKGKIRPKVFRLVLKASDKLIQEITPQASALFVNINYEQDALLLTSGYSLKSFSLDKSFEQSWDDYLNHFLLSIGV